MLALLPFILAAMSWGFWTLYKWCRRNASEVQDITSRAMSTLVIALFLVHPSIVQFMFYNFKCVDIDQE